eukprot:488420-Amorphochlora_amoeboformis.AAC.1
MDNIKIDTSMKVRVELSSGRKRDRWGEKGERAIGRQGYERVTREGTGKGRDVRDGENIRFRDTGKETERRLERKEQRGWEGLAVRGRFRVGLKYGSSFM